MADTDKTAPTLLDELATLDRTERREVAEELRKVSATFADVPEGRTASYVLGALAHLLDPALPVPKQAPESRVMGTVADREREHPTRSGTARRCGSWAPGGSPGRYGTRWPTSGDTILTWTLAGMAAVD